MRKTNKKEYIFHRRALGFACESRSLSLLHPAATKKPIPLKNQGIRGFWCFLYHIIAHFSSFLIDEMSDVAKNLHCLLAV